MSYTAVCSLLFLLFSCVCFSDVLLEENTAQTEKPEHQNVKENCASLTSGDFQRHFLADLAELRSTVMSLKDKLGVAEEQLRRKDYKVAFAATLGPVGNFGPFNTEVTLAYKDVFVNEGKAYNPATGIFTAPVKGVYFFTFSGHNESTKTMGLKLVKNGEQMVIVYNHPQGDRWETASNSISLTLEERDQVYMRLYENTWVFDNENDHTSFCGHLLFPL